MNRVNATTFTYIVGSYTLIYAVIAQSPKYLLTNIQESDVDKYTLHNDYVFT